MSDKKDSRLAKLYSLLENGEWLSKFTGIITISSDEVFLVSFLFMSSLRTFILSTS